MMQEANRISYPLEHLAQINHANNQTFLLRGFCHVFRNPINSILLSSELLKNYVEDISGQLSELDEESCRPFKENLEAGESILATMPQVIENIGISASRLNQFVNHLSEMTGRGSIATARTEVNIHQLVSLCPQMLQHQIRERTSHFKLQIEDNLPLLSGNGQQLLQAMQNLLINALISLPERSCAVKLSVSHNRQTRQVELRVCDQGCGIAPVILPMITKPFFTTWADQGCTGLGLTVAKQIIKAHNGAMRIDSEPGLGTIILVELPLPEPKESPTNEHD